MSVANLRQLVAKRKLKVGEEAREEERGKQRKREAREEEEEGEEEEEEEGEKRKKRERRRREEVKEVQREELTCQPESFRDNQGYQSFPQSFEIEGKSFSSLIISPSSSSLPLLFPFPSSSSLFSHILLL